MNWTPEAIKEAEDLYATHSAKYIAAHFGVSHDDMRQAFSRYGIRDPKSTTLECDRQRALRYRVQYRWSFHDIAEQLDRSVNWVTRTLSRAFRAMRTSLRVVYCRACVQLRLFSEAAQLSLFEEPVMSMAA